MRVMVCSRAFPVTLSPRMLFGSARASPFPARLPTLPLTP